MINQGSHTAIKGGGEPSFEVGDDLNSFCKRCNKDIDNLAVMLYITTIS